MHSFSYSVQEPSFIMAPTTPADEFDEVLQDVEISLETLQRNSERRTALFSVIQNDAKELGCRIQNQPKKITRPIDSIRRMIAACKLKIEKEEKEILALENRKDEIQSSVLRSSSKIQKLRERECLLGSLMAEHEQNMAQIEKGSRILERIHKTTQRANPPRGEDLSEN
ncbi:hypothetical protein GCK32_009578 [Trichostrongylus colubriformis]|uniref:Uncharacterized protein n=1 Tax=Trichostrongylus colubriformis TaxID=6319 RepID=A0AAN8IQK9_TRICO